MGIYISGLSLPPEGEKRLALFIGSDGIVDIYSSVVEAIPYLESIVCETEAIEVAPHGRLIEADKLMANIRAHDYLLTAMCNSRENGMFTCGIQQAVDEADTIIPADPDGGEANG